MAKRKDKAQAATAAAPEPIQAQAEPVVETPPAGPAQQETSDVACATCGGDVPVVEPVVRSISESIAPDRPDESAVLMKFTGNYQAPVTYLGLYRGCVSCPPVWVNPGDVARLESTGAWQKVEA